MKTLVRLLAFLRPYRGRVALVVVLSAILSVLNTVTIAIVLPILRLIFPHASEPASVDSGLSSGSPHFLESIKDGFLGLVHSLVIHPGGAITSLGNLCIFLVILFVVKNVVKYGTYVLHTTIDEGMMKNVRDKLFGSMVGLSIDFFNRKRTGDLISIVTNDVSAMNGAMTTLVGTAIREPLQAIIMVVLLLALSPTLTLVALSTSIVSLVFVRILIRYVKRYSIRLQNALGEVTSRLHETFQNIKLIKGYAAEDHEKRRFMRETALYVRSALKHSATMNLMGPVTEVFAIVAIAVVLFYGGTLVLSGAMRADELITFLFVLFAIMQPVVAVFSIPAALQRGLVGAERVLELIDEVPSVMSGPNPAPTTVHALQFLNVGFSYRVGQPVLRDVTLTMKHGQTIALVGPSGAGKSTLMDLAVRLYDPTMGGIYVDGVDIRELELGSYRSLFGLVTQESILFNDSVANNISYGAASPNWSVIREAAQMANAHDFIERLPQGYETTIGDRGILLSGGQRQRIAIARALARDPQILLFDEATSALDSESEFLVQEAIERLLRNRTALIIAHRLSTVKGADLIAVIDNGTIVERGCHDELLTAGGLYRRLYDVQFKDDG